MSSLSPETPNYLDLTVVLDPTVTSSSLWITIMCPQVNRLVKWTLNERLLGFSFPAAMSGPIPPVPNIPPV
ncbi:hypothetical protein ACTXT7_017058 [Hymenolepis weldensis]